ncbi:MAG: hypothetical protein KJP17_10190 [Gammaproteobacteria bacterium]|nr:hypothetical protein [Gammaproteobacteria bacterium]
MKAARHFAGIVAVALLALTSAQSTMASDSRSWEFSVLLDGDEIGYHRFELAQRGDLEEVRSEASFDVRFLFVTAFRYRHENRETWSDGCLSRIESSTRQNGRKEAVTGEVVDDVFEVDAGERSAVIDDCVMSFAYWNADFLEQRRLLNPQTGEYLAVEVEPLGRQAVNARGETVNAKAYRLVARDLELTVWYSDDAEWLGLESVAKGGRTLRYELT